MNASRLSLVMGNGPTAIDVNDASLPIPETRPLQIHLHFAEAERATDKVVKYSVSGWTSLIFGVAVFAAVVGGYQLGHHRAPDDTSNLRPMPALRDLALPEPASLGPAVGLPAIQRQLATPPQIIPPIRAPQQPGVAAGGPISAPTIVPGSSRNAFGLEN
ncbi:MAG: hypothetical protein EOO40_02800 [Deltaproteobacteria bacterium]|nr:MAG: hypothetical protein EOO40_02800 [Deltaproteobacteria bacterium]